jgi:hypothetical protein
MTQYATKIYRFFETLDDSVTSVTLRAGMDRRSEQTIEKWAPPFEPENIADIVDETMQSEQQGRLIAYCQSKQVKSISFSNLHTIAQSETALLVDGILRMAEEQRRFVATITDSFQVMHETIQETIMKERTHHEEVAELQLAVALAEKEQEQEEKSTVQSAIEMFGTVLQAKNGQKLDIKKYLLDNPDIVDTLLKDDDIVTLVTEKMLK